MDLDRIILYFGILIVALFYVLGIFVIFSHMFAYIPMNYRVIIGILLMLYGTFRLVLIYNKSRNAE